jgi:CarD family transcriptional regulator
MSAETTALKRGEMIVYPAHGVGVIEGIEKIKTNGASTSFYTIRITESGMTIRVPAPNAPRIGIRPVITQNEVTKLLRVLKTKSKNTNVQNWHKRQKSYLDKIKSGSVFELAEILKELTTIQARKELSFGEQRMYENVRQLITLEVAESKGIGREQADKLLDKAITA